MAQRQLKQLGPNGMPANSTGFFDLPLELAQEIYTYVPPDILFEVPEGRQSVSGDGAGLLLVNWQVSVGVADLMPRISTLRVILNVLAADWYNSRYTPQALLARLDHLMSGCRRLEFVIVAKKQQPCHAAGQFLIDFTAALNTHRQIRFLSVRIDFQQRQPFLGMMMPSSRMFTARVLSAFKHKVSNFEDVEVGFEPGCLGPLGAWQKAYDPSWIPDVVEIFLAAEKAMQR